SVKIGKPYCPVTAVTAQRFEALQLAIGTAANANIAGLESEVIARPGGQTDIGQAEAEGIRRRVQGIVGIQVDGLNELEAAITARHQVIQVSFIRSINAERNGVVRSKSAREVGC